MGYLIDILVGAVSRIVTGELGAHAEPLARLLIERAVKRLPADDRDRFREEWLAHLEETPGTLRKLWHAAGCHFGAAKVAGVVGRQTKRRPVFLIGKEAVEILFASQGDGPPITPEEFIIMVLTAPEKLEAMHLQVTSSDDELGVFVGVKGGKQTPDFCEEEQVNDLYLISTDASDELPQPLPSGRDPS
jgi:hypothetical protein